MLTRILLLSLCGASCALAQSSPRPLALDAAIRLAWSNDPSVLPLSLERDVATAREVQAAVRPRPELELQGSTRLDDGGEWGLGVGFSQQIPRRERVELARALARVEGQAAPWHIREQRRVVAGEVRVRYYDWIVRSAQFAAAQRNAEAIGDLLRALERRRAAGEIADAELELMRLEQSRAEQARALAEATLVASEQRLRSRLRVPADFHFTPAADLDTLLTRPIPAGETFDEHARPEIALAAHAVERANAAVGLARAESRAEWKLGAGVGFERRANDATGRFENEPKLNVGASVPLGRQPPNRGDILERQATTRIAEARLAAARADVSAGIAGAVAAARAMHPVLTHLRAAVRERAVPAAIRAAFERGEVSSLQVAQIRQLHLAMETEFLTAAAHYAELLAQAETALGLIPDEN
jgi:outer membrane protein, heavy metal efflux system